MSRNKALAMKSLRLISLYAVTLILTLLGGTTAGFAQGRQQRVSDPTALVDVFIGTGGHGHTHPAACVPHGMIQPGPDTRRMGWDACSGYHYADSLINGFAHQRLSGTGCADYGDFLVMPITGAPTLADTPTAGQGHDATPWASSFSHDREWAQPGYYAVMLSRYGILAEMTATTRAAIHRYTYPHGADKRLVLDLDYAIQDQLTLDAEVAFPDNYTLKARRRSYWWAYNQDTYFYAHFSQPFTATVVRDTIRLNGHSQPRLRAVLHFDDFNAASAGDTLLMRCAVSAVDAEGARRNLEAEIPHFRFDAVRRQAHEVWQKALNMIEVEPAFEGQERRIFYTALYHTLLAPAVASDVDGRYRGNDLRVHGLPDGETDYTVFSLWDTFRALHPLLSILQPSDNEAYLRCLLRKGEAGGVIPKWDCAANYTACMPGYHFVSLAADALCKGYDHFDVTKMLRHGVKAATSDTAGLAKVIPAYKVRDLLPEARRLIDRHGYIPCEKAAESVARGLEYAYDDWCIARLAAYAGDTATARRFSQRAEGWQAYLDPQTLFFRGKNSRKQWREPFNPIQSEHRQDDYCEGTAWQWRWFVPHDIPALMEAMGGKKAFAERLDSLFAAPSTVEGALVSADISGLIGQYAHGNEPSHHVVWLYNYAGRPRRTQELCDTILRHLYTDKPDGLAGNEDCGAMSAWYVLAAAGLYQVCPGIPVWTIGRPLFATTRFRLPNGKTFTICTKGNSPRARYVKKMTLNGRRLNEPFIPHTAIAEGGVLELTMTDH